MNASQRNWADRTVIFLFVCGLIVFWGFEVYGQEWNQAQKEVWEAVQANWETFKKGDVDAALAMKHDDVVVWFGSQPTPIKKEHLRYVYKDWFDYEIPTTAQLRPLNVNVFGNVANVYYLYKYEGEKLSDIGRVCETWVKQGNKWFAIGSLSSSCIKNPPCLYSW